MYDVIIIGGGVAAFTAALFTGRRGLKILVIGKDIGGQANYTDQIENFPGIEQTGGYELVSRIKAQAEKWGTEFLNAEVSRVKAVENGFVTTAHGQQYKSQTIILAFGKTPMDLGVPGESELKGKGVSYCSNCDVPLFKNKVVTVAGIGNTALDTILFASKYAKKVYALSKSDKLVGHPALVKAVGKKKNVELIPFVQIQTIVGEKKVEKLQLLDLQNGEKKELVTEGIFVELGYIVKSDFIQDLVQLDEQGQILVEADQATSIPGVFACGDATNRIYKQAVISAGEAATAALSCYDYLAGLKGGQGLTSDWTEIKRVK
jgi:thioredoxin reductase (NADPH)